MVLNWKSFSNFTIHEEKMKHSDTELTKAKEEAEEINAPEAEVVKA